MSDRSEGARAREYARLIDDITRVMGARLEEAQLPLHILLSSPFGALNENQEEMLGAAQAAVDAADVELRRLRKLVELDRGALTPVIQPVPVGELLRPVLAIGQARAAQASVQLRTDISDRAPRALVDATLAQEALTTLVTGAVAATRPAGDVRVSAVEREDGRVVIDIAHDAAPIPETLDRRLAQRLLDAQGAELTESPGLTRIALRAERPRAAGGARA